MMYPARYIDWVNEVERLGLDRLPPLPEEPVVLMTEAEMRARGLVVMHRDHGATTIPVCGALSSARRRILRPVHLLGWAFFCLLVACAAPFVWRWFGWL